MGSDAVILCNRSDANEVIAEARDEWIIEVLLALGVSEDTIELGFDHGSSRSREEFLYLMNDLGISIDTDSSGKVDVYKKVWHQDGSGEGWLPLNKNQIVAQWKLPEMVLQIEGDDVYYKIILDQWSIKNARTV